MAKHHLSHADEVKGGKHSHKKKTAVKAKMASHSHEKESKHHKKHHSK